MFLHLSLILFTRGDVSVPAYASPQVAWPGGVSLSRGGCPSGGSLSGRPSPQTETLTSLPFFHWCSWPVVLLLSQCIATIVDNALVADSIWNLYSAPVPLTSGRYASYWNAFLFTLKSHHWCQKKHLLKCNNSDVSWRKGKNSKWELIKIGHFKETLLSYLLRFTQSYGKTSFSVTIYTCMFARVYVNATFSFSLCQ